MMRSCLVLILLLGITCGCASGQQPGVENKAYQLMLNALLQHEVPEVGVPRAYTMKDSVIFLDTRSKEEYSVSHIREAVWVGYDDFEPGRVKDIPREATVIVYCSVGARSEKITEKLQQMGFVRIYNLFGGIFEWVNQGYPVYTDHSQPTEKVHAYNRAWGIWLSKGHKVYQEEED